MTHRRRVISALGLSAIIALVGTACAGEGSNPEDETAGGGETADSGEAEEVTITWWHNSNNPPGRDYYDPVSPSTWSRPRTKTC